MIFTQLFSIFGGYALRMIGGNLAIKTGEELGLIDRRDQGLRQNLHFALNVASFAAAAVRPLPVPAFQPLVPVQ